MRTLIQIVYALSPGGSELLAARLAARLNRGGRYRTSVYGVAHGGVLEEWLGQEGIESRAFGRGRGLDARAWVRLIRAMRAARPRLVQTHHLGQLLYGGVAARLAGARLIHTEHEFYTLARLRHRRLLRAFSRLADVVTTVAEPVTDFLRDTVGIPAAKLRTIPNGVEVERYRTAKPVDRAEWRWGPEHLIVGCIGRLSAEKGQDVLLDAFRQIAVKHPAARLLLIGDGPERSALMEQARSLGVEAVTRLAGARSDIPNVLAACDLVVLPSHHEGLPLVAIEAMAAGRPVVATAVGAVPRLLERGRYGDLVPAGNRAALVEAIDGMLADSDRRRYFGSEGRRLVEQRYNFDETVRAYEDVYESVVNREP